jgi:predicted aspartyl protease
MMILQSSYTVYADTFQCEFTDHLGLVIFDGEINGTEGAFLLDTGADNSIINKRFANELSLKEIKGPFGILGLGGISQYEIKTFSFGDFSVENISLIGMDLDLIERYLGFDLLAIIGGDLLDDYALTVDYQEQVFMLNTNTPDVRDNAVSTPIRVIDKLVFTKARTKFDGPEYAFLVDTGATATVYFKNRIEQCCPDYKSWVSSPGWVEATFLGKQVADLYEMPEFHVGNIGIEPMIIVVTEAGLLGLGLNIISGEPLHGVIGYSFLKQFRVTFDYPRKQMILEPYEYYIERFPHMFDSVGFMIAYENNVPIVDHIIPGTPAEKAGIMIGDKLLEIDGIDVTSMDSLEISNLFEGKPGTNVKMLFERDGKRFTETMKRVHLFK